MGNAFRILYNADVLCKLRSEQNLNSYNIINIKYSFKKVMKLPYWKDKGRSDVCVLNMYLILLFHIWKSADDIWENSLMRWATMICKWGIRARLQVFLFPGFTNWSGPWLLISQVHYWAIGRGQSKCVLSLALYLQVRSLNRRLFFNKPMLVSKQLTTINCLLYGVHFKRPKQKPYFVRVIT